MPGNGSSIVDFDAHHGNGTQEAFYRDGRVVYVSLHEWPLYPGTGRMHETGAGDGRGRRSTARSLPGLTGDVYLAAIDEVVVPGRRAARPHVVDPVGRASTGTGPTP